MPFTLHADFNEIDGTASSTKSVHIRASTQLLGPNGGIFDDGSVPLTNGVLSVSLPSPGDAGVEPADFGFIITRPTGRTKKWQVPGQANGVTVELRDFTSTTSLPLTPSEYALLDARVDGLEAGGGGVSSYNDLTDVPATFPPSAHSHAYADLTGKPSIPDSPDDIGAEVAGAAAAAQAFAVQRANHTGQQTSATISDLTEAVQDIVGATLAGTTGATVSYNDAAGTITITGVGDPETMRDTLGAALVGVGVISVTVNDGADTITISSTATQNSTDAALRDRSTHTGTQAASTITGLAAVATSGAKADVGLGNADNTSDANKMGSIDTLALTRIERQAVQSVRALGERNAVRAADATVFTEAWANTTAWTSLSAQVAGGRVFGSANPWAVQRAISVPAGGRFMARVAVKLVTGTSGYLSVNNDAVGVITGGVPNAVGIGFGTTANYSTAKGTNVTGSVVADWDGSPVTGTDYFITLVIDESDISWTIQAEGSNAKYVARVARSQMPGGPAITNLLLSGSAVAGTGTTFGPVVTMSETALPPTASKAVGGKTMFDATRPLQFSRYDSTTGSSIRHLVAVPGTYDPRNPAPVVLYLHGATEHAGFPFSINAAAETKRSAVTTALLAAGYIVVSSDNGTSTVGGGAGNDDKYANSTGVTDYLAAISYVREHFNTGAVFLWGVSMGGGFLQNILGARVLGGVAAAASVCPGTDLVAVESNPTYQAGVWAAYGAASTPAFLTAIAGRNPVDQTGAALRGVPQRFYVASDDTTAPPATHVTPLATRIAVYAPEAAQVVTTGGHVAASTFNASDVVAFFERYR